MIRQKARFLLACASLLAVNLSIAACETPPGQPVAQSGTTGPRITIQGESDQEVPQTIEINNCGGKAELARTERRTQTVSVTISEQIATTLGVSAEVVSAEVQAAVSVITGVGEDKSTEITLKAPAGTRMIVELTWLGNEQLGVAENVRGWITPIAFKRFVPSDVRVKSQYDAGCTTSNIQGRDTPSQTPLVVPTPRPVALPTATPTQARTPQKVDTQLTGGGITRSYTVDLANGDILVGHASSISYARGVYRQDYNAVAYLIVGPGQFKFEVFSGLWDKWTNTSSGIYKQLLDEQYSVPIVRDGHSPSEVQKVCRNASDSFECP